MCRRNVSFLETPLNLARHPLCVHFATPVVGAPEDADGEGDEAGGFKDTEGGRFMAGKGGMSDTIVGAMLCAVFWSRLGERKTFSNFGDRSAG